MKVSATSISGVFELEPERHQDERGTFSRVYCRSELEEHDITLDVHQCNTSFNPRRGTLRGMHYQAPPSEDPKVVRCVGGRAYDVVLDLRYNSPTYLSWVALELDPVRANSVVIPGGCAHGFLTLATDTELLYLMGADHVEDLARGVRWNDPVFGIEWPMKPSVMSERDATFPDYTARQR